MFLASRFQVGSLFSKPRCDFSCYSLLFRRFGLLAVHSTLCILHSAFECFGLLASFAVHSALCILHSAFECFRLLASFAVHSALCILHSAFECFGWFLLACVAAHPGRAAECRSLYGIHDAEPDPSEYLNHIKAVTG